MGSQILQSLKPSIRSTKGCWTCRLRKKKCDETSPCHRCESASIECHYGEKPAWIQEQDLGRVELEKIKKLVTVAASRKRAKQRAKVQSTSTVDNSSSLPPESNLPVLIRGHGPILEHPTPTRLPLDQCAEDSGSSWLSAWIKDQEANLIMHYLDHVFYIQFRFYSPSISAGGRGWFLSLITRTKPLYHAALSLAAFHQQSLVLRGQGGGDNDRLDELERQHNLTLQQMQLFIQEHSGSSSILAASDHNTQILACVVQMISFELFNGGASNWRMHLRAGCDLVLMIHEMSRPQSQSPPLNSGRSSGIHSTEATALNFFTGCIIWFDILSSISTNLRPNLADYHRPLLLGPTPETGHNIELHGVCGAHNWVMIIIGEIASLSHQRTDWIRTIDSKAQRFESMAQDIEFRLRSQYRKVCGELTALRTQYGGSPPPSLPEICTQHTILVVTSIFASAALVYLQTTNAPAELTPSLINPALQSTIAAMEMVADHRVFRGLIWPLCIAGCMASSSSEQDFFRLASSGAMNDSKSFGNSGKALEILERSWLLQRQRGKLVDCSTSLRDLGTCILLV